MPHRNFMSHLSPVMHFLSSVTNIKSKVKYFAVKDTWNIIKQNSPKNQKTQKKYYKKAQKKKYLSFAIHLLTRSLQSIRICVPSERITNKHTHIPTYRMKLPRGQCSGNLLIILFTSLNFIYFFLFVYIKLGKVLLPF